MAPIFADSSDIIRNKWKNFKTEKIELNEMIEGQTCAQLLFKMDQ